MGKATCIRADAKRCEKRNLAVVLRKTVVCFNSFCYDVRGIWAPVGWFHREGSSPWNQCRHFISPSGCATVSLGHSFVAFYVRSLDCGPFGPHISIFAPTEIVSLEYPAMEKYMIFGLWKCVFPKDGWDVGFDSPSLRCTIVKIAAREKQFPPCRCTIVVIREFCAIQTKSLSGWAILIKRPSVHTPLQLWKMARLMGNSVRN